MPAKRRGRGLPVKSELIRRARLEAGLSLEQLAGSSVSRQAVHQIEQGRIRPSLEVLRSISSRIGRPLEDFLDTSATGDPESGTTQLERLFLARDFEGALALAADLQAAGGLQRAQQARVELWLGASLVGLSRPVEAVEPLRRARALAEEAGDPWCAVEAMDWEACAMHLSDAPGAVALAESALVACRVLHPVPAVLESRILGHLGSFFVRRREWPRALAAYEDAVRAAAKISDLRQLALMHHNLSIAHQRLGNQAAARREAERGLALYAAQAGRADLARMQSDYGDLLRRQGDLAGARRQLNTALETFQAAADERGVGYTLLTLAEVNLAEQDHEAARRLLDRVGGLARAPEQPLLRACVEQVEGRLAAAAGTADADSHFQAAIALFESLDHRERAAETRIEYANLLEGRGELRAAIAELRQAAGAAGPTALTRDRSQASGS